MPKYLKSAQLEFLNHRNPNRHDDYEYYKRCVSRFRASLLNDSPTLIYIEFNSNLSNKKSFIEKMETIRQKRG